MRVSVTRELIPSFSNACVTSFDRLRTAIRPAEEADAEKAAASGAALSRLR
jgi:hypothetical protein